VKAGPTERVLAGLFLMGVTQVADNPSDRVMNLQGKSNKQKKALKLPDRIIFGTGEQLGIPTVTHDSAFVRAAQNAGLVLKPPPVIFDGDDVSYSGR
jgi:hypothetical protein